MTNEELLLRKENFKLSKHFFEIVDSIITQDIIDFKDLDFKYFLITSIISKFIIYKEDIWIKNKQTKTISTNFPRYILDDVVFKGELLDPKLSIHHKKKRIKYKFNKIEIENILEGKENDSVWIIDNIRDSFAHGHFYIDVENQKIIINNEHNDRKLKCTIDFTTFSLFEELTNLERIGGYTNKNLNTCVAFAFYKGEENYTHLDNENHIRKLLASQILPIYYEVIDCKEENPDQKYEDLINFYNFFSDLLDTFLLKNQSNIPFEVFGKRIENYINKNMSKYTIKIHNEGLSYNSINKIINYINEDKDFYKHSTETQFEIIKSLISGLIIHQDCSIERGIQNINNFFALIISSQNTFEPYFKNLYKSWCFKFIHSFIGEQRLSNLFILGINNFVSNKESVYDKVFEDYNDFDISNFKYKDYSGYRKLVSKLTGLNEELKNTNNTLTKAEATKLKLQTNLLKAPNDKKEIISNNIADVDTLVATLKNKIIILVNNINNISIQIDTKKSDETGHYIDNCNKNFFNHLRNAFAHNRIRYADDRVVYNRKVTLEDFDDNGNLSFKCECRLYDLIKLLNNDLFLEALNSKDKVLIK